MPELSEQVTRKFTDIIQTDEWEIFTDSGWQPLTHINQTIPYEKWNLELENCYIDCADDHIVFDQQMQEVFVKDTKPGQLIQTDSGLQAVRSIVATGCHENMYDITVNSADHRFYSNGILSHNSVTAAGYLLWASMFNSDQTILIAAHKFSGASEIMNRIRFGYESCPDFIRAGITEYNKQSLVFDNSSRIVAQTTTETTGRGMSISILYCLDGDTTVQIRDKQTIVEEEISLAELYSRLFREYSMFAENTKYEILTPTGWKDFKGIMLNGEKETAQVTLKSGVKIIATQDHKFFQNGRKIALKKLEIGSILDTEDGYEEILDICSSGIRPVFDVIEVADSQHRFLVNGNIITKNCDELSFVRPTIAREFWTSSSFTLSTGGKAIITSTPNNIDDQFATIWNEANKREDEFGNSLPNGVGRNGFFAVSAHWSEHPDRDEKWAEEHRIEVGPERFAREIELQFIVDEETLINPIILSNLTGKEPIEKQGQIRWYVRPTPGNIYLVGLDPSLGTGGDPAAIQVFEAKTNRQVAEWTHNRSTIETQVKLLKDIVTYLVSVTKKNTDVYYSVENNSIGEAVLVSIRDIGEESIPGVFLSEPIKLGQIRKFRKGFTTTNSSKLSVCARFKHLVETGKIQLNSKKLISELRTFISSGNSYKAKVGETDDLVLATLLVLRMMEVLKQYIPDIVDFKAAENEDAMPLPFIMSSY